MLSVIPDWQSNYFSGFRMNDAIGQGNRRGLPALKKLTMVLAVAGVAFPALAGDMHGVALRQDGNVLRLRVVRKPLDRLTVGSPSARPEIPEDYHIEMLDWAAYLALRIVDDDAGSPRRAADFKATFEESVRKARTEVMRKLFAPMDWGFGRGGFSWGN